MHSSQWSEWLAAQAERAGPELAYTRDAVLSRARIREGDTMLDLGTGRGLVALAAAQRVGPRGRVIGCDRDAECLAALQLAARAKGLGDRVLAVQADVTALPLPDQVADVATTRSVLQFVSDRSAALRETFRVLRAGGRASFFEPLNSYLTPHHKLIDLSRLGALGDQVAQLFESIYADPGEPMLGFDERDLVRLLEEAGFVEVGLNLVVRWDRHELTPEAALRRLSERGAADRPSILELVSARLGPQAAKDYGAFWTQAASSEIVRERRASAFVWGLKPQMNADKRR